MAPDSDNDHDTADLGMFDDPEDYYPPTPPPTTQSYTMITTGHEVTLHLVGHSPLEAHRLWNGSRIVSEFFESDPARVKDRTVLEVGAGAGLPSLVAAALGARRVVVTDYPDHDLVANMWRNIDECDAIPSVHADSSSQSQPTVTKPSIVADGFVWGADPAPLLAHLRQPSLTGESQRFDVLILADLLFRHSEHGQLVKTIRETMTLPSSSSSSSKSSDAGGVAYVFFTSYRPWLRHKDLAFFDLARADGFVVTQVVERKMDKPLFENDPGDEDVLKTVLGFEVRWPDQ